MLNEMKTRSHEAENYYYYCFDNVMEEETFYFVRQILTNDTFRGIKSLNTYAKRLI